MKGNNKRTQWEIIYDILSASQEEIKKTHLMYKTNMTYLRFKEYLEILQQKDLIEERFPEQNGTIYCATERGNELLESLNVVRQYLK